MLHPDSKGSVQPSGDQPLTELNHERNLLRSLNDQLEQELEVRRKTEAAFQQSNKRFRRLMDANIVGIMIATVSGKILEANDYFLNLTGFTREEFKLGKVNWRTITPPEWLSVNERAIHELHECGTCAPYEKEYLRRDGVRVPVFLTNATLPGPEEQFIAFVLDQTERKRAEAERNHERNLLRAMLDHSDDSIYFKDLQSRFLRCSTAQMQSFQTQGIGDVIGKTDYDFFSSEHANDTLQDEQKIIRTGEPMVGKVEKETWLDGRITWAFTSKMPLRNEAGEIVGTFGISKDITAIKETEAKVNALHHQLMDASRLAGMAEAATSVLHNVGNVLNSVNVSSSLIAEKVRQSKVSSLAKVVALLQTHAADLPGFFATDPQGRQLPSYLASLATRLTQEQAQILIEAETLANNLQHIKEVIAMQQSHAMTAGLTETLPVVDMVEDALRLNLGALDRHGVKLVREYSPVPPVSVEKHKVLQILVNLIRNAEYACDDSGRDDKQIILRVASSEGTVKISVEDNGVGIAPDNLTRIFGHGFTTRKEGHGFGLHSGALAAKELGGSLKAFSKGPGQGAIFTLELPLNNISTKKIP
jgi:PAS domain S-box-containing protein